MQTQILEKIRRESATSSPNFTNENIIDESEADSPDLANESSAVRAENSPVEKTKVCGLSHYSHPLWYIYLDLGL